MAININPGSPLRHVATFNASGTFTAPQGKTIAFVAVHGASGGGAGAGGNTNGGSGGAARITGGFVQIIPGGTHAVVIGAAGTAGASQNGQATSQAGGTGGTTSFDGAIVQTGGNGAPGTQGSRYGGGGGPNGTDASAGTGTTTLTALNPSGALTRVASISNQATGAVAGGSGGPVQARYSNSGYFGGAGVAGSVNIYL